LFLLAERNIPAVQDWVTLVVKLLEISLVMVSLMVSDRVIFSPADANVSFVSELIVKLSSKEVV